MNRALVIDRSSNSNGLTETLLTWVSEIPTPSLEVIAHRLGLTSRQGAKLVLARYKIIKPPAPNGGFSRIYRTDVTGLKIRALHQRGFSLKEVCQRLSCHSSTVHKRCPDLHWKRFSKTSFPELHDLKFLASTAHVSPTLVAGTLGCSVAAVKASRWRYFKLPRGYFSLLAQIERVSIGLKKGESLNISFATSRQAMDYKFRLHNLSDKNGPGEFTLVRSKNILTITRSLYKIVYWNAND